MKYYFILFSLTTLSFCLKAQTSITPIEKDVIEVTGTAEEEIMPDEIYVKVVIREKIESREKVTLEQMEEKLKQAVTTAGVDLKNLSISDLSADYIKLKWNTKDVMSKKEYILKTTNTTQLKSFYKELDKIDVEEAEIYKVSHSKIDSLRKSLRIKAIKAAKDKASYLTNAINESIGKCLLVKEDTKFENNQSNNNRIYGRVNYMISNSSYESYDKSGSEEIGFKKINITYSVFCKFEIKH